MIKSCNVRKIRRIKDLRASERKRDGVRERARERKREREREIFVDIDGSMTDID